MIVLNTNDHGHFSQNIYIVWNRETTLIDLYCWNQNFNHNLTSFKHRLANFRKLKHLPKYYFELFSNFKQIKNHLATQ